MTRFRPLPLPRRRRRGGSGNTGMAASLIAGAAGPPWPPARGPAFKTADDTAEADRQDAAHQKNCRDFEGQAIDLHGAGGKENHEAQGNANGRQQDSDDQHDFRHQALPSHTDSVIGPQ